jgi:hypothetical protein
MPEAVEPLEVPALAPPDPPEPLAVEPALLPDIVPPPLVATPLVPVPALIPLDGCPGVAAGEEQAAPSDEAARVNKDKDAPRVEFRMKDDITRPSPGRSSAAARNVRTQGTTLVLRLEVMTR